MIHATTILAVRHRDAAVLAGDGQVTLGSAIVKHGARKIRRLYNESILAGFAGSAADSFALFSRFEAKLEQYRGNLERAAVELAKDWRTDRALRRLEAMLVIMDKKSTFLLSGTGDLIEPDDGIIGIGSGGAFAQAAAKALVQPQQADARDIADESMRIASEICVYTNGNDRRVEELRLVSRCRGWTPVIRLPERTHTAIDALTPREIVGELDKHVVGQKQAKRAVAIALRNRMRRQKLPPELADEVAPKNILMIGPTGVGKTEIARRLAKLAQSPFLKVEASKFTEVGYVGRDVESMVRDLVEIAVGDGARRADASRSAARRSRTPRSACSICSCRRGRWRRTRTRIRSARRSSRTRERLREQLRDGRFDDRVVEIEVREKAFPVARDHHRRQRRRGRVQHQGHDARPLPGSASKKKRVPVREAREALAQGRRAEADRHGTGVARRRRSRAAGRHHLPRRDRQDRRPRGRARPRRQPRGRAARHPADRRGHDRQHQARHGADRSHPVHRGGRVPRLEAVGSDSRAAGPLSDSRRARAARTGRVRAHPDRAAERARQAVHRADGHRRRRSHVHATMRFSSSPSSRRSSTSGPRTSARAGCTR